MSGGEDTAQVRAPAPVPPEVGPLQLTGGLQADQGGDAAGPDQGAGPAHQEETDHLETGELTIIIKLSDTDQDTTKIGNF